MADEFDPRLEARLRDALHHEADNLPFTLRAEDVEPARRVGGSTRTRMRIPVSLIAAAAAIVILVVGVGAWRNAALPYAGTASPDPRSAQLESYADLAASLPTEGGQVVLAQGEDLAGAAPGTGPRETVIGTIPANAYVDWVFDCRGDSVSVSLRRGQEAGPGGAVPCGGRPTVFSVPGFDTPSEVVVTASTDTIWRVVVGGMAAGQGSPTPAPSPAASPSPDDCVPLSGDALARNLKLDNGSGLPAGGLPPETIGTLMWHTYDGKTVSGGPTNWTEPGGPLAVDDQTGLTFDPGRHCFANYRVGVVSLADLRAALAAGTDPPLSASTLAVSSDGRRVTVKSIPRGDQALQFSATWRTTDGTDDTDVWLIPVQVMDAVSGPTASPSGSEVLPSYEDLAAYPSSTIELLRNEGVGDAASGTVEFGEVAGKFNLEVVLACTGSGEVRVSVRGGGVTSPVGRYGCGGPGTILWTALEPELVAASRASLAVDAPAGTAWRMLVYDHSSAPRGYPEAPVLGFDSKLLGTMGGTMAANETVPVEAPVVPPGSTLVVSFGCEGQGLIHLVADGIARDAACLASNVMEFVPAGTGPSRLEITPDHTVRLNLELRSYTRKQAGAAIDVPSAELGTVTRSSAAPGFTTCLTSWRLPDGTTGDEGCGSTWRPIPDGRAIRATAGEILETGATDGWTITGIEPFYADNAAVTADATLADWVPLPPVQGPGVEGRFTLGAPPPGDWAVRLAVTGRLADGTTFTADQAFRVIVGP
jgi:hypothetical protein